MGSFNRNLMISFQSKSSVVKSSNCVSGLNCDKAKQPGDNNVTECTLKKKKNPEKLLSQLNKKK